MKDTFYFSHDYEPTSDPKIQAMIGEYGAIGYGVYWRIIEMLHSSSDHVLPFKKYIFLAIAKQMLTSAEQVEAFVKQSIYDYELFDFNDDFFWSNRVLRNIESRKEISMKRSVSGKLGAEKRKSLAIAEQMLANAKQAPASDKQNIAKERKEKERKEYESKENELLENYASQIFTNDFLSKEEVEKVIKKKKEKEIPLVFPYESEKFKVAWGALVLTKKWKPKLNYSLQLSLDKLKKYDEEFAILMIEEATEKGWQGLEYENTQEKYQKYLNHKNGIKNGTANQGTNLTARLERNQSFGTL